MSYEIVGGCVAPARLASFLRILQTDTHCAYASIYRGSDAAALLHRIGKSTQEEIYWQYTHGLEPNPANPPGRSTHELRSDGVAYPSVGPGMPLPWWCCGVDVDVPHVPAVIAAAARYGWEVFRPYPSGSEYHHVNFRKQPTALVVDLRAGDFGNQVWILTGRLKALGYLRRQPWYFGSKVEAAVKRFQRRHQLRADGVVGPKTWLQIQRAAPRR